MKLSDDFMIWEKTILSINIPFQKSHYHISKTMSQGKSF